MTHPTPEALASFVDGTANAGVRAEVAEHIESCDDCLMVVGETARLLEEEGERRLQTNWQWILVAAAAAALVLVSGWVARDRLIDPVSRLAHASRSLRSRAVEGRLDQFPYAPPERKRGQKDVDGARLRVEGMAGEVRDAHARNISDPTEQHAAGIGALLAGDALESRRLLMRATELEPENARYWNDLAVAVCEVGRSAGDREQLRAALAAAERAVAENPSLDEARFNRAVILESLGPDAAAYRAYGDYLKHDDSSAWAREARQRRDRLRAAQ